MAMRVVALAGGVGGAKLASGLAGVMEAGELTIIVNTGDDFEHVGLTICPDLDTVVYTLAGLANPKTGWGRAEESWNFLQALGELGGPTWFRLGDKDLATHVERTRRLRSGERLSEVMAWIAQQLGVQQRILPMSDDSVRTVVETEAGDLPFQEYFVAQRCEPVVRAFRFERAEQARPAPGALEALAAAHAVIFCPSNPWVSIDPILAVPGFREALAGKIIVGVSPIIAGKAVRGPAATMFRHMGVEPSPLAVARHFEGLLDGLLIDEADQAHQQAIEALGISARVSDILMKDEQDRLRLARESLQFAADLLARKVAA